MNSAHIIEVCTHTTNKGDIYIKSLSSIDKNGVISSLFHKVRLWDTTKHSKKRSGPVLFGHSTWESYENTSRNLVFMDEDQNGGELDLQIRLYALVSHFRGRYEGDIGLKLSTLQTHVTALKKLALWMSSRGYKSFHELDEQNNLVLRNFFHQYLTECLRISIQRPWRTLDDIFTPQSSLGLFSARVCLTLAEVKELLLKKFHNAKNVSQSYPIIPLHLHKNILSFACAVIKNCENKIENWEKHNNILLQAMDRKIQFQKGRKNYNTVESILRGGVANKTFDSKSFTALSNEFDDLKLAVFIYILSFTGMRVNEVLSCKIGCGKYRNEVYEIWAETSKIDETKIMLSWVANKETYDAIQLFERYTNGMMLRAEKVILRWSNYVKPTQLHNLSVGLKEQRLFSVSDSTYSISFAESGRFTKFEIKSDKYRYLFDLTLTEACINELDRLECNYIGLRGDKQCKPYKLGDTFNLSNHMFRHSWAYFVVANKLGHHDDVTNQYKHLSEAMSRIYADRGLLTADELVELVEGFEQILTKQIGSELANQAEKQTLRGGAGERFNKAAQSLIIGITDSNSGSKTHIKQVHFKDVHEFKAFLVKNLDIIRGLPHGYCTAGDSCKIKGAAVPSGCVACGSFVIAERHIHHWVAMKNNAETKLTKYHSLSLKAQEELELFKISWLKDLNAANNVLNEGTSPLWQQEERKND